MSGQSFAKLFDIDGIGQVLAVLVWDDDDDREKLELRIPDHDGMEMRMSMSMAGDDLDPDKTEDFARKLLDGFTAESAAKAVAPLVAFRDRMLAGED